MCVCVCVCVCVCMCDVYMWGVGVPSTFGWGWRELRRVTVFQCEAWFNLGGALGILGVGNNLATPPKQDPQTTGVWKCLEVRNPILPNFAGFSPEIGNQSRSNRQDRGSLLDALGHSQMLKSATLGAGLAHLPSFPARGLGDPPPGVRMGRWSS